MKLDNQIHMISGNSNRAFAEAMARRISVYRGEPVSLADARVERFNDGEIFVEVFDNVRNEEVFIIQSTSKPANDNLMELLIMADALRRASAKKITAVLPYFGYARQDRKTAARTPIFDQMSQEHIDYMLSKIPRNRFLEVDEAARMIVWLASAENSFSTGAVFDLSGGRATY